MPELGLLPAYQIPARQRGSHAAMVPAIRDAVHGWRVRDGGYAGATETTRLLLRHWFETDHEFKGEAWRYYYCQREAIETIIFLYEVMQLRRLGDLAKQFDSKGEVVSQPALDRWARYVLKMATGSGKTKVMSLVIAWAYFNAVREQERRDDYAKSFAIIAPNVIVYQRLLEDFRDGKIFREDPVFPPEWRRQWQMSVVTRDDPSASTTPGTIYLTNVHQLYDPSKRRRGAQEPAAMTAVLGGPRPSGTEGTSVNLRARMLAHRDLMVLNDEGHHLHTDELEWAKVIEQLHDQSGGRLRAQFDFTATPKHQNGRLFNEIVVDYPIAQAIEDEIVKRPILGELKGDVEYPSENAAERHRDKLTAGVRKWEEKRDQLAAVNRKPLLFIMAEDTKSADEIAEWLAAVPGFSEETILNIHTKRNGEITEGATAKAQRELDELREAARRVDEADNPYSAIVSVLMLREGWDVRNVCVIVALRPYTAKSQILPEQTLGRGLRRMFPVSSGEENERVIVIEHEAFRSFWEQELDEEGLELEWVPVNQLKPQGVAVTVDEAKLEFDVAVPEITPALRQVEIDWDALDIEQIPRGQLAPPSETGVSDDTLSYYGIDILTYEVVDEDEFQRDFPLEPGGFLNAICRRILRECRLHNLADTFARLAPPMKHYIETRLFTEPVSMEDEGVMMAVNRPDVKVWLYGNFVGAIRRLTTVESESRPTGRKMRVSETKPFLTTRPTVRARKTVFNRVPCDSALEADFARFLDRAEDVEAFAKNAMQVGFGITYLKSSGAIGRYYPDFLIRTGSCRYVVETKGFEDVEVARKDAAGRRWCEAASACDDAEWRFLKVGEAAFRSEEWKSLEELESAIGLAGD